MFLWVFGVAAENKNNILESAPQMEGKFASAPLPTATGAEDEKNAISFSAPIAIFKTTEHPEAAKEWVKYFCSEEVQLYLSQQLSLLNSNVNVMQDPYFTDDEWLRRIFRNCFKLPVRRYASYNLEPAGRMA